jgi:hypothetical protein
MSARPIVLLGSEQVLRTARMAEDSTLHFDGRVGVWRDREGRMAISGGGPTTTKTATREGIDQSEVAMLATLITKTREGVDQSEATAPTTLITETGEGIDQSEGTSRHDFAHHPAR